MTTSRKVYIYNGQGVGPLSTSDLNDLFTTSKSIFPGRPDVLLSDFKFNLDQLKDPVFVVPGGSTSAIGLGLKPQIEKIKAHFDEDFGYVGVCAGAYLGACNAELYYTTHAREDEMSKHFQPASYLYTTKEVKIDFSIINNYRAFGAFYPNESQLDVPDIVSKTFVPYRVSLAFPDISRPLSQLYLAGPGLISELAGEVKSTAEIVATYAQRESYTLYTQHKIELDKPLAAMVRKMPEENKGGKLLSATHIETCIAGSKLLSFFKSAGPKNAALNQEEYSLLLSEQKDAQETIETLLRDTLNKKNGPG